MSKKLLFVFGTRPEAIKLAMVIKTAKENFGNHFEVVVCVTAQHRRMLDQVLEIFSIKPDYDLNIMSPNQNLFTLTGEILAQLKNVLDIENPDYVIVHGDTTTTFSASLAAFYSKIPVIHIEAGLRTNDIYNPWPEEVNRKLTSQIALAHFTPTIESQNNLIKEFITKNVYVVGNTVIDSLLYVKKILDKDISLKKILDKNLLDSKVRLDKKIILVTTHRRENFGAGIDKICSTLVSLSVKFPDVEIAFPVHLNPNIRVPVQEKLKNITNIKLIEPLDYLNFVNLMVNSYLILTDSGGIQEEAPSLGKPVLVMRETTERPEAVSTGTVFLVGTDSNKIIDMCSQLLNQNRYSKFVHELSNPYGDGSSSMKILNIMSNDEF
jgi:UDP-N-acetylglucosamine 2-epimerase (non-hydrolysing)